jgi:L-aspartate oxidase
MRESDFLVIGSGIAGLTFALSVAEQSTVIVITKKEDSDSATNYAQGGIAAVEDSRDSFASHIEDTINAGAGLCHRDVVELVVREGPECVRELIELGVEFTRNKQNRNLLDLGREGGHSKRRIVHAKDLTGQKVEQALLHHVRNHRNIVFLENHMAVDLLVSGGGDRRRCIGCWVLDACGKMEPLLAKNTLLATGGAGKAYLVTTNLEFVQFHPTCLYYPGAKTTLERSFLISEAVRGEGGILITKSGERFAQNFDPRGEMAPRDIVARAIDATIKEKGDDCVYLDMRPIGGERIKERFPNIYQTCLRLGIDVTKEPVPVVPAAHYFCGGVWTDTWGRTNLKGLSCAGEAACTGMHGANRLASNSLLDALVIARQAADIASELIKDVHLRDYDVHPLPIQELSPARESAVVAHEWASIRRLMHDYVGVVRSDERLAIAQRNMAGIRAVLEEYSRKYYPTVDSLETRNIAEVATMVIYCAIRRRESRGLHYNIDHPDRDDKNWQRDSFIDPPIESRTEE